MHKYFQSFIQFLFTVLALAPAFGAAKPVSHPRKQVQVPQASALKSIVCAGAFYRLMDTWEEPLDWKAASVSDSAVKVFRSPTSIPGVWLETRFSPAQTEAYRINAGKSLKVSWSDPDCMASFAVDQKSYDSKLMAKAFTDQDLQSVLASKEKKSGFIYVWSPQMNLSLIGLQEAQEIAKKMNLRFIPVLDPYTDPELAEKFLSQNKLPMEYMKRLESPDLFYRGALIHYPNLITFKNGKLSAYTRPGYDSPEALQAFLRKQKL